MAIAHFIDERSRAPIEHTLLLRRSSQFDSMYAEYGEKPQSFNNCLQYIMNNNHTLCCSRTYTIAQKAEKLVAMTIYGSSKRL